MVCAVVPKMKLSRGLSLLMILLMLVSLSAPVLGGDIDDPEVTDDTGSGDAPEDFKDIDSAWFGDEGNQTLGIRLRVVGPPISFLEGLGQQDTTPIEYEVYFDVDGNNYAVSVEIPYARATLAGAVLGTYSWSWSLKTVKYATGNNIESEDSVSGATVTGTYDYEDDVIEFEINKEDIEVEDGSEGRNTKIENPWVAVWNAETHPDNEERDLSDALDYGMTRSSPGRTYTITGGELDFWEIMLSTEENRKTVQLGESVEFIVVVFNNSTVGADVNMTVAFAATGWTVNAGPTPLFIENGEESTKFKVTVSPPADVKNGSALSITVRSEINVEGNGDVDQIVLTVTALVEEVVVVESVVDKYMNYIIAAIAIIIILVIIMAVRGGGHDYENFEMDEEADSYNTGAQTPQAEFTYADDLPAEEPTFTFTPVDD